MRAVTLDEKIHLIGRLIGSEKKAGNRPAVLEVLGAIHADLEARERHVPSAALVQLDRCINAMNRSKTGTPGVGYAAGPMASVAQEVSVRWPVIQQALERFGAEIEQELTQ